MPFSVHSSKDGELWQFRFPFRELHFALEPWKAMGLLFGNVELQMTASYVASISTYDQLGPVEGLNLALWHRFTCGT